MATQKERGFTLVEVLITTVIVGVMMAMAMTGSTDLYRKYTIERGYRNMHVDVRRSMAYLNRDVRYAAYVTNWSAGTSFTTNLCLFIPNTPSSVNMNSIVQYKLSTITTAGGKVNNILIRNEWWGNAAGVVAVTGTPNSFKTITSSNHSMSPQSLFTLYLKPGQPAITLTAQAAEVRAYLLLTNTVLNNITTDRIQVRVQLRNK